MAAKRSHDMERQKAKVEAASLSSTLDPDAKENVQECRVLIENNQVGGIIGKSGANVRKVRADTGAAVSILKPEFRDVKERIMVIKGTISQISKALGGIAQLVIETLKSREKKTGGDGGDQAQLRILVHKFAVGAIIGKGGATIREIQQETTTRIQVANEPQPSSTEKTVTITGNPEAIESAAFRVLTRLEENPLRSGTTTYYYVPGQLSHYYGAPPPYAASAASPPSMVYGSPAPPPLYPYVSSPPQRLTNRKLTIPTNAAGAVIGRGGSVIRDIRAQSGTTISIADPDSATSTERVATITGTSQGISSAVYMIRNLLDQYQHSLSQQQPY